MQQHIVLLHLGNIDLGKACLCQLGREIGFTTDALKNFVARKTIQTFTPYHPSVMSKPLYHFEVPSMFSQVNEEITSGMSLVISRSPEIIVL